jgi:Ca-activated chloride channel family protein
VRIGNDDGGSDGSGDGGDFPVDTDCITVDMAVSSEKITLLTELAQEFNDSDQASVDGTCVVVRPYRKASGAAARLLVDGWPNPDIDGNRPVVWSPAASGWGAIVNHRTNSALVPPGKPFMLTPLVIAMPEPMAQALGWPEEDIGFADIVELANDPEGWARYGHPEWGPFRLGKTNPNYSTSGLNFTVAEYYAATGKSSGITSEDLDRPEVTAFARSVESAVVHYGDITMTFLNNWFRADTRGTALTYASAVAIEEKSIIDYNRGNPDGELQPGEVPRPPRIKLVAIYPEEGTLYSDNPFFVLDAPWVTEQQKQAAALFEAYVQQPENQRKVLEFGFRPGNPAVALASPINPEFGVDPTQPQAELPVPPPAVLVKMLDLWAQQRKEARVLLVLDVSGSMGDPAQEGGFETKLDLAKEAAVGALSQFKDDDLVGLRIFSTDLGPQGDDLFLDLVPIGRIGDTRETLRRQINGLFPTNGTPLYDVTARAFEDMRASYDPALINAVVLLTDGVNDDGDSGDDDDQLQELLRVLRSGSEGGGSEPIRVFPISYGAEADKATLQAIAEATNAALYDASDPRTIDQVFTAVISNF